MKPKGSVRAFVAKNVIEHAAKVKLVSIVDHTTIFSDEFHRLLTNAANLITDMKRFKNSVAMVGSFKNHDDSGRIREKLDGETFALASFQTRNQ